MKKLLSSVLVAGLLGAVAVNAADDEIVLEGTVTAGAVVGFENVSGESLGTGSTAVIKFKDPGASIDFGTKAPGETFDAITKDLYVKTNNGPGVTMELTDATNSGNLAHADGDTISIAYELMGSSYTIGTTGAVDLVTAVNDGTSSVGTLKMTPAELTAIQKAGDYTTTLSVTIALK
ncbi:MAG: hypothetical protein GXO30_08405 [Epsilonproteobacteria bacterium]|nr:hypothetical protein [Campylobacterota bacterium]